MKINDNIEEIHTVVVHEFKINSSGFISNEEITVLAERWDDTEQGKWVHEHAIESPALHWVDFPVEFDVKFKITAKLRDRDYFVWTLKFK